MKVLLINLLKNYQTTWNNKNAMEGNRQLDLTLRNQKEDQTIKIQAEAYECKSINI